MSQPSFERVRRVRSFDDVTQQIREAIVSGRIREGDRLPSERELCETFGVSRPTLREALRSLEAVGIIEIRPGKTGGAYAVTPAESTLGSALATLVNLRGASAQDLAEFRVSFEGENAWWAAQRAEPDDLATLRGLVAQARAAVGRPGGWEPVGTIDARWHEALARATRNGLRIGIALGIHEAVIRQVSVLAPTGEPYGETIPRDLEEITAAVAARDGERARALMRTHIEEWNRRNVEVALDAVPPPA
jgi:GntR family transcriptional repressor for pyruvate dehydrogenase complex